jgi:transcriptional regulator with XRE-family HTH domain
MPARSQDPLLRAFGAAVRSARLSRGLSQEGLAEVAGLHVTYVSSLERGRRNVSLLNLDRLARGLALDLAGLMSAVESERTKAPAVLASRDSNT